MINKEIYIEGADTLVRDLSFSTSFQLRAVPPYDFSLTVHKPAGWSLLTPYEIFEGGVLWTAMRWHSGEMFGLKLSSVGTVEEPEAFCELFSHEKLSQNEKKELSQTLTWMLSLREDIREFYSLSKSDPFVRTLVKDLYGMRRTKRPDVFPMLMLAVSLQMAPIKRSDQMMTLLIEKYGETVTFDGKKLLYWPSPEKIARATVKQLEQRCKLGYRAKVLRGIAEDMQGFPTLQDLEAMSPMEATAKLTQLKGIGEYSADIVSPHPGFALDIWSAKIFNALLFQEKTESPRAIIPKLKKVAEERWGKWRGYVFTYVLNDLKNLSRRFNLDLNGHK